jgi:hypothetical protein
LSARLGSEVFTIGMRGVKQPEQCLKVESAKQSGRMYKENRQGTSGTCAFAGLPPQG